MALSGSQVEGIIDDPQVIFNLAVQEVKQCLRVTDDSFDKICRDIETASSRAMLRLVFRRFNGITQILLRLAPPDRFSDLISKALCELKASPRLQKFLSATESV